jgi:hypothetical protein
MTKEELYLKTIFCCIACDGDIATEEVDMVKDLCAKDNIFHDVDSEKYLNSWITEINEQGGMFLQSYLKELISVDLNETEQLLIVSLAIKAIEADNRIEYAEVKFFFCHNSNYLNVKTYTRSIIGLLHAFVASTLPFRQLLQSLHLSFL